MPPWRKTDRRLPGIDPMGVRPFRPVRVEDLKTSFQRVKALRRAGDIAVGGLSAAPYERGFGRRFKPRFASATTTVISRGPVAGP